MHKLNKAVEKDAAKVEVSRSRAATLEGPPEAMPKKPYGRAAANSTSLKVRRRHDLSLRNTAPRAAALTARSPCAQDFGLDFVNDMQGGVKSDISHDAKAKGSLEGALNSAGSAQLPGRPTSEKVRKRWPRPIRPSA